MPALVEKQQFAISVGFRSGWNNIFMFYVDAYSKE